MSLISNWTNWLTPGFLAGQASSESNQKVSPSSWFSWGPQQEEISPSNGEWLSSSSPLYPSGDTSLAPVAEPSDQSWPGSVISSVSTALDDTPSGVWGLPHFAGIQDFGKRVCEYWSPLIADESVGWCVNETAQTAAALGVASLAALVAGRTLLNAYRIFSARRLSAHECASRGNLYALKRKLRGADVDSPDASGWTVLMRAAARGHLNVVKYLLNIADPNIQASDRSGDTALHRAIRNEQNKVVSFLLGKVDIGKVNARGQTPLMVALECANEFATEILAKRPDIDWDATDLDKNTVFHYAAKRPFCEPIFDHFQKSHAFLRNLEKEYPLFSFITSGNKSHRLYQKFCEKMGDFAYHEEAFKLALEANSFYAAQVFDPEKVVTKKNSDLVGLAMRKGHSPKRLFAKVPDKTLKQLIPEGFHLAQYVIVYGLDDHRKYLEDRGVLAPQQLTSHDRQKVIDWIVLHALVDPKLLSKITTRKVDPRTFLRSFFRALVTASSASASAAAAAAAPSAELRTEAELFANDAEHYFNQVLTAQKFLKKS